MSGPEQTPPAEERTPAEPAEPADPAGSDGTGQDEPIDHEALVELAEQEELAGAVAVEEAVVEGTVPGAEESGTGDADDDSDADSDASSDDDDSDDGVDDLAARLAEPGELAAAVEAILFVTDTPLDAAAIAAALAVPSPAVEAALMQLRAGYDERGAGIELRDAAGGVRLYTRPTAAPYVERFLQDGQRSRLSQAALETLAVIAYRQPVTRSRVSAIRGVNVDGVVRTLLARGLIVETGTDPDTGAGLFATSELFLERMGMQSLDELPSLAPLLPDLVGFESDEL